MKIATFIISIIAFIIAILNIALHLYVIEFRKRHPKYYIDNEVKQWKE